MGTPNLKTERELNYWKEHHCLKIPYLYLPNQISGEELKQLTELKIDFEAKPVPLFTAENRHDRSPHTTDYKSSKNSVTYYKEELNWLDQHLKGTIVGSDEKMWKFGPLHRDDAYEFVCFNEGGFIGEHADAVVHGDVPPKIIDGKYTGRLLTQVILMSEKGVDFEGGELEIQNAFGFWLKVPFKSKGDVCYFPSILPHRVTTIEKGRRVTLTTFLSGSYPERIQDHFNQLKKDI